MTESRTDFYPQTRLKGSVSKIIYESYPCEDETSKFLARGVPSTLYKITSLGEHVKNVGISQEQRYSSISRALRQKGIEAAYVKFGTEDIIAVLNSKSVSLEGHAFGLSDERDLFRLESTKEVSLNALSPIGYDVFRSVIHNKIQNLFLTNSERYRVGQHLVYDISKDFGQDIVLDLVKMASQTNNNELYEFADTPSIYRSLNFSFTSYGKSFALDLSAGSKIICGKSLWELFESEKWTVEEVKSLGLNLSFEGGGTAYFAELLKDTSIDAKLENPPFLGRTYREYVEAFFPYLVKYLMPNSCLLSAIPWGNTRQTWTYAAALMKPTLNFETISNRNFEYFQKMLNVMKLGSNERLEIVREFRRAIESIPLGEGYELKFNSIPWTVEESPLEVDFNFGTSSKCSINQKKILEIRRPKLAFRDESGYEVQTANHVPRNIDRGTLTDLMVDEKLRPYETIDKIRLLALVPHEYYPFAPDFLKHLENGWGGKYKGFSKTFSSKLEVETKEVEDTSVDAFRNVIAKIDPTKYDEVIVFIPAKKLGREIYSEPKLSLLRKGLPSQMITDEPRVGRYDRSLATKAKMDYAMYGVALQVAAKAGIVPYALSKDCAERFASTDIIMGYDTMYIPVEELEEMEQRWSKTRPKVPQIKVACPMVVLDRQGVNVENLGIFGVERNLFAEQGDKIYELLQQGSRGGKTFVMHKDGSFSELELRALDSWAVDHGLSGAAVSIITGSTPRTHRVVSSRDSVTGAWRTDYEMPFKGQVLILDDNSFVMNTTGLPEDMQGWPKPITIHIHPINKYEPDIVRILGQIYAFSQLHTGSIRSLRLPVTIHFPNLIGEILRSLKKSYLPKEIFLRRSPKGNTPRWFY